MDLVWLCGFAFVAGLVDAIVGGGGLIQLPALFVFLPEKLAASVPLVFGTNKLASMCGTGVAMAQYARRVPIPWRSIVPAAVTAFVFSALGARVVQSVESDFLKPLTLALLIAVAIYTYSRKSFGHLHAPRFLADHERLAAMAVGLVIGFYDGFFGPGTGSFLIFLFIGLFGFDFLTASASAKVINLATNLAAVIAFAAYDDVLYGYALPMGACNIAGALVGTRLAILKGNSFVRTLFLGVVAVMIARFAWEQFAR
ncbi:MAG TPA: TSUP family transporter [Methylomirabilota bacterium]|nr:TSUP family transporter [Methylomirabilota bacterium]